jgi:tRNA pseudouridine38-40 synthase
MRHIRLVVEYDGTGLHGWQRQPNGATVQQHLEEALAKLFAHEVSVTGASRTDSGVHARGQVASFRTERTIPVNGIRRAINAMLPPQIAIRDAAEVPESFHPRFSATAKHYRYTLFVRGERSPRWRDRAWHYTDPLALPVMIEAAQALVGAHDFSAFRAAGCAAKTTVRRVDSVTITRPDPERVEVDIRGNAFLRQMVRIMVGTLAEAGSGRWTAAQVAEILVNRDRTKAGITAPPQGLELIEVRYDGARGEVDLGDV